ncbi:helix-turn-helix domain-containing protein [Amycolatopsis sacchari]
MELRQLECFVAVVEESSFTRAAARLHVRQRIPPRAPVRRGSSPS